MPVFNNSFPLIVTSASQPGNIQNGEIWTEQTSDGNVIEQWNRVNSKWVSGVKNINFSSVVNIYNYYFIQPISTLFDLYINNWESQVYWGNTFSDTYTFGLKLYCQPNINDTTGIIINNLGSWTSTGFQSVAKRSKINVNQAFSTNYAACYLVYTAISNGTTNYQYHFGSMLNGNYIRR